jgi:hypothetical protein
MNAIYYNWIRPKGRPNKLIKLEEEETWGYFVDLETSEAEQSLNKYEIQYQLSRYKPNLYTIQEEYHPQKQYIIFIHPNTLTFSASMIGLYILVYLFMQYHMQLYHGSQ